MSPQGSPKVLQEGAKMAQEDPKIAPEAPSTPQEAPKRAQRVGYEEELDGARGVPSPHRWPSRPEPQGRSPEAHEAPTAPPGSPKRIPRGSQKASKKTLVHNPGTVVGWAEGH